jgi:hypothetical protein
LNSDLVDTYGPAIAGAVTANPSRATANAFISLCVNYLSLPIHYNKIKASCI